jgi:hypothetical protein
MQLCSVPRLRATVPTTVQQRRAQAPEAPTVPSLIDVSRPEMFDPLTALTTGDESEFCGMQGENASRASVRAHKCGPGWRPEGILSREYLVGFRRARGARFDRA